MARTSRPCSTSRPGLLGVLEGSEGAWTLPLHLRSSPGTSPPVALLELVGSEAPRAVVQVHRVLGAALRQAVKWGLLAVSPTVPGVPPGPIVPSWRSRTWPPYPVPWRRARAADS
jgi:hypothetical protein